MYQVDKKILSLLGKANYKHTKYVYLLNNISDCVNVAPGSFRQVTCKTCSLRGFKDFGSISKKTV